MYNPLQGITERFPKDRLVFLYYSLGFSALSGGIIGVETGLLKNNSLIGALAITPAVASGIGIAGASISKFDEFRNFGNGEQNGMGAIFKDLGESQDQDGNDPHDDDYNQP